MISYLITIEAMNLVMVLKIPSQFLEQELAQCHVCCSLYWHYTRLTRIRGRCLDLANWVDGLQMSYDRMTEIVVLTHFDSEA